VALPVTALLEMSTKSVAALREQPLLPVLDVFSVGWEVEHLTQGAASEMLSNMTHDPACSS